MGKTFIVTVPGEPSEWLTRLQRSARSSGARFEGDTSSGTFSSRGVAGSYSLEGKQAHITVSKKPFLLPWALVESSIRGFFQ